MRFLALILILSTGVVFAEQAKAGFEWVPPLKKSESPSMQAQPQAMEPASNNGYAAPTVTAEPLGVRPPVSQAPTPLVQQQPVRQTAPRQSRNLSRGNKLVIDPYPLRNSDEPAYSAPRLSQGEVYKAMNEKVGKLNPVKLGNGMTTGAKPDRLPEIPTATRTASISKKTFLTPSASSTSNPSGLTPMKGAEPAPLAGVADSKVQRMAVDNNNYAQAIGFGRDLPLALALSQVIPSNYTHGFSEGVKTGTTVSWEGGKPWNVVLNDMLRPRNLTAVIQGNQVIIQPMASL